MDQEHRKTFSMHPFFTEYIGELFKNILLLSKHCSQKLITEENPKKYRVTDTYKQVSAMKSRLGRPGSMALPKTAS